MQGPPLRWAGAGQVVVDVITADGADEGPGVLLARADLAHCTLLDPGHSDQHGNSNHARQYLRVATLTNLANLPTPVNLAISAKPFWPFCPPCQPWPTQATSFFALETLEPVRPGLKAKGSFKKSIQFNLANLAMPNPR